MKSLTYNYALTLSNDEINIVKTTGFERNLGLKINSTFRNINNTIKFDDNGMAHFTEISKLEDKSLAVDFINSSCLTFFFPRIKNITWSSTKSISIVSGYLTSNECVFKVDLYLRNSNSLVLALYETCLKSSDLR